MIYFACDDDVEKGSFIQSNDLNISAYLSENEDYSKFTQLLVESNLFDALNSYNPYGNGSFTVFAPTDEALQNYISENDTYSSFEDLINDAGFMNILVRFHIVLSSYNTNDFPFGALNDSTITGDYLTIGFQTTETESHYLVNNYAVVVDPNIELSNGFVHGINKVLEPIILSSYEWLKNQDDVSIFVELLEETGLADSMGINKLNTKNQLTRNRYTLFVEPDSVFEKRGIGSFQDLVQKFGTPGLPYEDVNNGIYRFAAYHLLEKVLFLNDMSDGVYNTYTALPIRLSIGTDIKINPGFRIIDSLFSETDTLYLDYVPIIYEISNNPSANGPVHFISELLELHKPGVGTNTFHFKSEAVINELKNTEGRFIFEDPSKFEVIHWEGTDELIYVVGTEAEEAWEDDFIEINGPFIFTFNTPRVFPGRYDFQVRVHSDDYDNAVIQIYLDGKRSGTNLNLKSTNSRNEFVLYTIGTVDFLNYSSHEIKINTVIPGIMKLDLIRFDP
jgi:uncharacterized surface protein with fasciclin (FAS1) repeats